MPSERLIDRIVARSPNERRMIHVPEWDADIYFPPLTRAQLEAALPKDGVDRAPGVQSLFLLVHLAQDKDGKPVFRQTDIEALRTKADLGVLTRVESFMWGTITPNVDDAEKALRSDPRSASA